MSDLLNTGPTDPPSLVTMLADTEGEALVTRIHTRRRLTEELAAADAAYTAAVQAAVARHGDWASVQVAADVVRQCRAALRAAA